MREIKFRGWNDVYKDWVVGHLTTWRNNDNTIDYQIKMGHENCSVTRTVMAESVGQYTGLNDKNGVEIYEGDILQVDDPEDNSTCIVVFHEGAFCKNFGLFDGEPLITSLDVYELEIWKVIGNVVRGGRNEKD